MDMCYDGALIMPSNYAVMDEEEMIYVEGGVSVKKTSMGYKVVLSAQDCGDLAALAAGGSATMATVSGVLGATGVGIPAVVVTAVLAGVSGVGSAYMWLCSNHKGATINVYAIGNILIGSSMPIINL